MGNQTRLFVLSHSNARNAGMDTPLLFQTLIKEANSGDKILLPTGETVGSTRYRRMQGERVHDTYTPRARTTHHAPPRYIHTHHTWNIFMHKLDSFAFPHIPLCRFTPLYSIPCNSATRLFPHPCMYPPTSMDARNDSGFVFGSQAAVAVFQVSHSAIEPKVTVNADNK